jgi:hypothetical protein
MVMSSTTNLPADSGYSIEFLNTIIANAVTHMLRIQKCLELGLHHRTESKSQSSSELPKSPESSLSLPSISQVFESSTSRLRTRRGIKLARISRPRTLHPHIPTHERIKLHPRHEHTRPNLCSYLISLAPATANSGTLANALPGS